MVSRTITLLISRIAKMDARSVAVVMEHEMMTLNPESNWAYDSTKTHNCLDMYDRCLQYRCNYIRVYHSSTRTG